jgi:NAD(P)-dependent dehydrogenase (short-subunit alcohol dehydrogenase family)
MDKTVIVIGGSQGIGAGLVNAFLERNVVANSRNITKSGAFESSGSIFEVGGYSGAESS